MNHHGVMSHMMGGGEFSPIRLFSGGQIGAFYDPSPTTCFTDVLMTTPAGEGDRIAAMVDSSGNSHTVTQNVLADRPVLRKTVAESWYLDFVQGDYLTSAGVNILEITSPDAGSFVCGMLQASSDATNTLFSVGPTNTNTLNFLATFNNSFFYDYGNSSSDFRVGPLAQPAGWDNNNHTLEGHRDELQGDFLIDGVSLYSDDTDFSNDILSETVTMLLGSDTTKTFMLTGRIYSLFVRGVVLSTADKLSMQTWTDARAEV